MTDFRALCAELVDALAEQDRCWMLINDARAALAQPEPVVLTRPDCFDFAMDFLGGTKEVEVRNYVERLESTTSAALAQPDPKGPSEAQLKTFACEWWHSFGFAKDKATCTWIIDHVAPEHFVDFSRDVLARWGRPAIEPVPAEPVWADIHYAWELLDAEGEWQAGGSANSLDDVQREGNRYLQTYAQDGPHKLIIQRHCVNTIEEVTND